MKEAATPSAGKFRDRLEHLGKTRPRPGAPAGETAAEGAAPGRTDSQQSRPAREDTAAPARSTATSGDLRRLFKASVPSVQTPASPVTCEVCRDKHTVIVPKGEFAHAQACGCAARCPHCGDRGYRLVYGENGYAYHQPCVCRELHRRIELFNRALLPSRYSDRDLSNFQVDRHDDRFLILQQARAFAEDYPPSPDHKPGLLLVGSVGLGKTHLVCGIIKVLTLEKGVECRFRDFWLLLDEVRAAYDANISHHSVLQPLADVEVLVLDELGKGRAQSEWEQGILDDLICRRYNQLKTTIFTTNFPLIDEPGASEGAGIDAGAREDARRSGSGRRRGIDLDSGLIGPPPPLSRRVGDRIYSRLKQMCQILRLTGQDYRGR